MMVAINKGARSQEHVSRMGGRAKTGSSDVIIEALALAKMGLKVVRLQHPITRRGAITCSCARPECTSVGKHPMTPSGYKDGTSERTIIRAWFNEEPQANLGIVTGKTSGIFVLDVDPRNGGDKSLEGLFSRYGPFPATWTVKTGGGGAHYYFRYPGVGIATSHGKLGSGLDVQSDGAFVVAPPSIHISQNNYQFAENLDPASMALANPPEWLVERTRTPATHVVTPVDEWRRIVCEGADDGDRNVMIARLAGHLLRKDVDALVVLNLLTAWNQVRCRPPLSDDEVHVTINSIAGREFKRRQL